MKFRTWFFHGLRIQRKIEMHVAPTSLQPDLARILEPLEGMEVL